MSVATIANVKDIIESKLLRLMEGGIAPSIIQETNYRILEQILHMSPLQLAEHQNITIPMPVMDFRIEVLKKTEKRIWLMLTFLSEQDNAVINDYQMKVRVEGDDTYSIVPEAITFAYGSTTRATNEKITMILSRRLKEWLVSVECQLEIKRGYANQ